MQEPTTTTTVSRTKRRVAVLLMASTGLLIAGGSAAFAVSGGGYSSNQQGCQATDSDYDTPAGQTYSGCHNTQLSVENGQTSQGNPSQSNTKYVSVGEDQAPIDPNSVGTNTEESIGVPGNSGSPHGFCVQANTNGTNQTPATSPEQQSKAIADGCKDNPSGTGFAENIDYYEFYCPIVEATQPATAQAAPVTGAVVTAGDTIGQNDPTGQFGGAIAGNAQAAAAVGQPCEDPGYTGTPGSGFNSLAPTVDTGTGQNLTPIIEDGVLVYYGMDDNNDNGEHDGVGPYCNPPTPAPASSPAPAPTKGKSKGHKNPPPPPPAPAPYPSSQGDCPNALGAANGSSDGGAITLALTPLGITNTPSQTNPEGILNFSTGFCADGICAEGTTQQQTVYHGCGANAEVTPQGGCTSPKNANVYDYAPGGNPNNDPSVNNESYNCNSGDPSTTSKSACGSGGMDGIRESVPQNENAEPGIQIYSDPDPQRSPAVGGTPFWPTPGLYIGTCGVYAGSPATTGQIVGKLPTSSSPVAVTNAAGQIAIDPNPSVC